LHVSDKESVVLVGPSGGGKSVLLKTVAGLLPCDEGKIELGTKNVGMLFQKNALFDSFTCEENLLFPLKERKGVIGAEAKRLAAQFLESVGLKGTQNLFPDEISGGMQKRLGIARALIVEPELILYDEPTAGLDPITSRTIADLIRELRAKTGSTLLTVTNDMQRAYQLGDRVCLLAQGKLVDGGTPAQVQATQDPAIRQFIYGLRQGPLTSGLA
jgi:phospholipid/cholesterol/gamma-HCH transport system ATP-binding protein